MLKNVILIVLLLGLAWISCAELLDSAFYSRGSGRKTCDLSGQTRHPQDERNCDHCATCVVADGHTLSVAPNETFSLVIPFSGMFQEYFQRAILSPRSNEIFHPPSIPTR